MSKNPWITHCQAFSHKHKISYREAIKHPECKATYKGKGIKSFLKHRVEQGTRIASDVFGPAYDALTKRPIDHQNPADVSTLADSTKIVKIANAQLQSKRLTASCRPRPTHDRFFKPPTHAVPSRNKKQINAIDERVAQLLQKRELTKDEKEEKSFLIARKMRLQGVRQAVNPFFKPEIDEALLDKYTAKQRAKGPSKGVASEKASSDYGNDGGDTPYHNDWAVVLDNADEGDNVEKIARASQKRKPQSRKEIIKSMKQIVPLFRDPTQYNADDDNREVTDPNQIMIEEKDGKGLKKPNRWVQHVKAFANKRRLKYGDALKHPDCKKEYRVGGMVEVDSNKKILGKGNTCKKLSPQVNPAEIRRQAILSTIEGTNPHITPRRKVKPLFDETQSTRRPTTTTIEEKT